MNIKTILLFSFLLALGRANAQDLIIKNAGDEIKAKVLEITSTEIKYKRYDNPDGPIIALAKSDVLLIRYENGTKEIFQNKSEQRSTKEEQTNEEDLRLKGVRDAQRYYIGQNSGAGWTAATTILISPLIGLIPGAAIASAEPTDRNLNYPDPKLMENYEYRQAYKDQAHKTKKKKVWTTYGMSSGVWLVLILLL